METIKLQGIEIEVDKERTAEIYTRGVDGCQCDFCNNAHIMQRRSIPPVQIQALQEIGVNPWTPCLSGGDPLERGDPRNHTRRLSCWFVYGKIIGPTPTPKLYFDKSNFMWANTSRSAIQAMNGRLNGYKETDPDLIYVFASNLLPWIYGEIGQVKSDYRECQPCHSKHLQTGYLTKRSLIPTWVGQEHLHTVLLERKNRVYGEFCSSCGNFTYQLVPKSSPKRSWPRRKPYRKWRGKPGNRLAKMRNRMWVTRAALSEEELATLPLDANGGNVYFAIRLASPVVGSTDPSSKNAPP